MKLVYFRDPKGNYGDDLNPWLWDRLLPGVLDEDESAVLIGVGTILEPWFVANLPPDATRIVMGSGGGMEVPPIRLDDRFHVYAVRGPLTASYLDLPPERAVTDPAVALHRLWTKDRSGSGRVGFMPHHTSLRRWDWRATCARAGLEYVDPHGAPDVVTAQIAGLKAIVTEAMHGAIVADALRVPWLAVQINALNYVGKWHDWGASLGLPVHFKPLPDLYDPLLGRGMADLVRGKGARHAAWELRRRSGRRAHDNAARMLRAYAEDYTFQLSEEARIERALERLDAALDRFRTDHAAGRFG